MSIPGNKLTGSGYWWGNHLYINRFGICDLYKRKKIRRM